jgi:hypothetical protein
MKRLAIALGTMLSLAAGAPSFAATCSSQTDWASLGPPGAQDFAQSFGASGSYVDCYTFSLTGASDSFGGLIQIDPRFNKLDINVFDVSLYSGGVAASQTAGSALQSDAATDFFSFNGLGGGTYTLAVSTLVSNTPASAYTINGKPVSYDGSIYTSIAAAVPEPDGWAMAMLGLVFVGAASARRKSV